MKTVNVIAGGLCALIVGAVACAYWWRLAPHEESDFSALMRMEKQAPAEMLKACTNAVVGITRIIQSDFAGYSDRGNIAAILEKWKGEVLLEHVNTVGGIERTNLHLRFSKTQDNENRWVLLCWVDPSKGE